MKHSLDSEFPSATETASTPETLSVMPESSLRSPLSAIDPRIQNPFRVDIPLVIALIDLDGTLVEASGMHSIVLGNFNDYILKEHPNFGGNIEARQRLAQLCRRYKEQEDAKLATGMAPQADQLTYEQFIIASGNFYAQGMKGVPLYEVFRLGREFVEATKMEEEFYEHAQPAIALNSDYGVYTAIMTGAPEPVARPLARKLGAQFYIAMKLEARPADNQETIKIPASPGEKGAFEQDGRWWREVKKMICTGKLARNTGTAAGKNDAVQALVDPSPNDPKNIHPPHSIIYGWGNSAADLPLVDAGRDSYHTNDFHGFGIIINPDGNTWQLTEEGHHRQKKTGKLRVLGKGSMKTKILDELDAKLRQTFGDRRNAKKIAQILAAQKLIRTEIIARFKQYRPNDPDFVLDVASDLKIFSPQFLAACEAHGIGREARKIIDTFRRECELIIPAPATPPQRSSNLPPPPESDK